MICLLSRINNLFLLHIIVEYGICMASWPQVIMNIQQHAGKACDRRYDINPGGQACLFGQLPHHALKWVEYN